jgi:hypothetical protein
MKANDDHLIDAFLRNGLSDEEKKQFNERMHDEVFKEELQLQMALNKALLEEDQKEFALATDNALKNFNKRAVRRKIIVIASAVSSIAALLFLVFLIYIPSNESAVDRYIAMAEPAMEIDIQKYRNLRNTDNQFPVSIFESCERIFISSVPDSSLKYKYFFHNCTLFTSFDDSFPVKIIMDYDVKLQKVYFLCKDRKVYKLSKIVNLQDGKIYNLLAVENPQQYLNCN